MQSLRRLGGGCYLTTPPCPTLRWLAAQGPCRSSVGVYAVQDAGRRPRGRTRCASPGAEGQEPGFTTCRRADSTVFSASSYSQEKGTGEPAGSWPRRRSWTGVGVGSRLRRCRGRNHVSHCVGDESVRVEMYNECCFIEPHRQAPVTSGIGQENHGRAGRTPNPKRKPEAEESNAQSPDGLRTNQISRSPAAATDSAAALALVAIPSVYAASAHAQDRAGT